MAISGVREVRQFGAKGDGTGDDTEAVKKAIESLPRYGGVLYFPPGIAPPSPPPSFKWDHEHLPASSLILSCITTLNTASSKHKPVTRRSTGSQPCLSPCLGV